MAAVTSPVKYVGVNMDHGLVSRGLNIFIPSASAAQNIPISAVFLAHFNVHTGYELKWSKSVDEISLEGVEFKALPSGLHERERDVITFVLPAKGSKGVDDLLYGVCVFHQNLKESESGDRSTVKMYSLGVIVDPYKHRSNSLVTSSGPAWKPANFSCGVEHVEELNQLLDNWKEEDGYDSFEKFFEAKSDIVNVMSTPSSLRVQRILPSENAKEGNHHYLLKLNSLLETLGPLIFKVWRCSLLRQRIIFFDAPSLEESCAFAYCLSILSTVPQKLKSLIDETTACNLQFNRPVFSVGVSDIDWLKTLASNEDGFIAVSSDEIIMFKNKLYDTAVQLQREDASSPVMFQSKAKLPGAVNVPALRATQRDLKRFNVLVREYELYKDSDITDDESSLDWWAQVTEPLSWRYLAWSGFYWWASAGEKELMDDETYSEGIAGYSEIGENGNERLLSIVGYFQSLTKRIFRTVKDIVGDLDVNEPIVVEYSDLVEMGLDPYSTDDIEFVIEFIKLWWNRDAKVGSSLGNLCCFM